MSRIEWKDSFSVNHKELDSQHRELIGIYNNLHESLINDSPTEAVKTKLVTLEHLKNYISFHFETEETFLKDLGFPELTEHCLQHREFTKRIKKFVKDIEEEKIVLSTSLMKLLRNWITDHITNEDQKYGEYYQRKMT